MTKRAIAGALFVFACVGGFASSPPSLGALFGCGGGSESPAAGEAPCTPVSSSDQTQPEVLESLVAGGRSADGTLFVVDRTSKTSSLRLFVSNAGTPTLLRRRNVGGSGESSNAIILSADDGLHVRIELTNGTPIRMGISRALAPNSKSFEIGKDGSEALTMLTQAEISALSFESVPESDSVRVSYAATTSDQRKLIVIEPTPPTSASRVRVFFGTPERMLERKVLHEIRDHTIHLTFDLDGIEASALLTFCGPSPSFGPASIKLPNGTQIALTPVEGSQGCLTKRPNDAGAAVSPVLPDTSLVAGHQFFCI